MRLLLLRESEAGHRADYLDLFRRLLASAGVAVEQRGLRLGDVFRREPIFSTHFEEHGLRFALIAAVRALMGRRSVTLLFMLGYAVHGTRLRQRLKRWTLMLLRNLSEVQVLSIVPFPDGSAAACVADGWIHDPQLWDLPDDIAATPPVDGIKQIAGDRAIVTALGKQTTEKGFAFFCQMWLSSEELRRRYLFVAAGKVAPELHALANRFVAAGGVIVDRFIGNDELFAFYCTSDLVWSCYAPVYDQASGIFGRAVQLGRRPIVRAGSYVEAIATELDLPVIALPWNEAAAERTLLQAPRADARRVDVAAFRRLSLARLGEALGIERLAESAGLD